MADGDGPGTCTQSLDRDHGARTLPRGPHLPLPTSVGSDLACAESVAIVHDYLNQRGGAERVVLELARMWPRAPIYTSLYRSQSTFPEFARHDIRCSYLDRVPSNNRFRALFVLYPSAFRSLGTLPQDVVISSSSGWAHGVRVRPDSTHVVYCHNPARWLYSDTLLGVRLGNPANVGEPITRVDETLGHRSGASC